MTADALAVQRRMLGLATLLDPELRAELERLFAVDVQHQAAQAENADLRRQLHASSVVLGELRGKHADLQARFEELGPAEYVHARREAYMSGAGFLRIRSLGGGRYASEHIPAKRVVVHGD